MVGYAIKRVLFGISLILVTTAVTFVMVFRNPRDIAQHILGDNATSAQITQRVHELGLNHSLVIQYFDWLYGAVQGDLGTSYLTSDPVSAQLIARLPVTLSIVFVGVLVTAVVSIVLGLSAAVHGGWLDRVFQVLSVLGLATPNFWLGLMLVLAFAVYLPIFPATGFVRISESVPGWLLTLVLPVSAMAMSGMAAATQQVRGAMLDILGADFLRTLRSRGLSERSILLKHCLKNAASPALTVLSLQFIGMLSGAIVIEKVFALPGLGTLAVNATLQGDIPVILGTVAVMVVLVVLINLLIDLGNAYVNPKIRFS